MGQPPILLDEACTCHAGVMPSASSHRDDIDGLRAFAVISVLLFHAFPRLLPGGFTGVDIFFVISGFVITKSSLPSIRAGTFKWTEFYLRRLRRLMPALVLVIATTLMAGLFLLLPADFRRLGTSAMAAVAFLPNLSLWVEGGYFDVGSYTKPLKHLWSLGVEEQFYFVWPILVLCFGRGRHFPIVLCLAALASLTLCILVSPVDRDAAFYLPQYRFWELAAGCLLAMSPQWKGAWLNHVLSIIAGLGLLASVFLVSEDGFPGYAALLPVAATALLIATGPSSVINARGLASAPLTWLGRISYPLYLWHWPLLVFAWVTFGPELSVPLLMAILGFAVILAATTYYWVELALRLHFSTRQLAGAGVVAAMLVGLSAFSIYRSDGALWRYPEEIRQVLAFQSYEFMTDARYPACWLSDNTPFADMSLECRAGSDGPPAALAIWGDSHAARLYPGLRRLGSVDVSQFTRNACPPILDLPAPGCALGNREVMQAIRENPPRHLLMFAAWFNHTGWFNEAPLVAQLDRTISELQAAGVGRITVIGSAPNYPQGLPSQMFDYWRQHGDLPSRLPGDPTQQIALIDAKLAAAAEVRQVEYVSMHSLLCDDTGCLTSLPGHPSDLMTWDYGHLTTNGAAWIVEQLVDRGIIERTVSEIAGR